MLGAAVILVTLVGVVRGKAGYASGVSWRQDPWDLGINWMGGEGS